MACQPVPDVHNFETRSRLTRQRISKTRQHIRRIEAAKVLVCGIPSEAALNKLRQDFEAVLPLVDESLRFLTSGKLDDLSDAELREVASMLQSNDTQMTSVLEGSLQIGLSAVEPFPRILAQFKALQERLQSQTEGILLSLSDSFQDLVEKSAQDMNIPA
ncbi:MAG: hypothetical protein M3O09_04640 [Acidobacteriota bacterium]|nr:hypothetical protein [Acidobacteriota bacterium]